jgi:nucleotide-binding universal stress UspA family protein
MRLLICSDGTDPEDKPAKLGGLIAGPCHADTTLLGIIETPDEDQPLRFALNIEAALLRTYGVSPEVVVRAGEPIRQILNQTAENHYDIAVIGARRKGAAGSYCYSERTYDVIKAVPPPVLVATGEFEQIKRILVCTGGKRYIEDAVRLTGKLATSLGASVTLFHVMAEPPAIYADLVRMEEDVDQLLESRSELGLNLRGQRDSLQKMGVNVEVRVRHGVAINHIFEEVREGHHDMIVTGSSQALGPLRHYIMADLTRSILNLAVCPVLVARGGGSRGTTPGMWNALKRMFTAK